MNVIVMGLLPSTTPKTIDTLVRAIAQACAAHKGSHGLHNFDPTKLAVSFPVCLLGSVEATRTVVVTAAPSSPEEVYLRTDMNGLAKSIGEAVKKILPQHSRVRCLTHKPQHSVHGIWSSEEHGLKLVVAGAEG